ncbi:MAG: hypothetical protein V1827_05710 [Candidatus Micrarchaeota archaeon]
MVGGIKGIARRPFDGDKRKGPRHSYIMDELKRRGCRPYTDMYGNIWVEKGSGKPLVVFSSHLDVDPRIRRVEFSTSKRGKHMMLNGILDNAVGCYINMLLAQKGPKDGKAIYVFTASEEVDRKHNRHWGRSAREIVKGLKQRGLKPDLCVAIDVTYPKLLHPPHKIDWSKEYHHNFDIRDKTHCYLDGFTRTESKKMAELYVRKAHSRHVAMRRFKGHDEAFIYDRQFPAFAFGPVVYGHFDKPDQMMPLSHLRTALRFLRHV